MVFGVGAALGAAALALYAQKPVIHSGSISKLNQAASAIPIVFEPNLGQAGSEVRFVSRYGASTLLLTKRDAQLLMTAPRHKRSKGWMRELPEPLESSTVRMTFPGAAPDVAVEGVQPLQGRTNYFLGSAKPFSVSQYQRVRYRSLYPGVDLIYYGGNGGRLEHDFVVAPGGDPSQVRLAFPGSKVSAAANGDLMIRSGAAVMIEKLPVIYQETAEGRREISGGYRRLARSEYGFRIGAYDHSRPLVIDPQTVIATGYLGGSGSSLAAVATDATGNLFFTGELSSLLPGAHSFGPAAGSTSYAFVIKVSADFTGILFTSVFGGAGMQAGLTVQADASGQAVVAGYTTSTDFPVFNFPVVSLPSGEAMFVTKLNPTGSMLMYSHLFPGSGQQIPIASAIDPLGNFFVAGSTTSPNLPLGPGPSFQPNLSGNSDGFILKIDPSGNTAGGTFFGGPQQDEIDRIAFFNSFLYFVGTTNSPDLATTPDAPQPKLSGGFDAGFGKFSSNLSTLAFFTYFGGPGNEAASDFVVSPTGQVVIGGTTNSTTGFPQANGFPANYNGGNSDGFVAEFQYNPLFGGQPFLVQTTLLGGPGADSIVGVAPIVSPGGGFPALQLVGQTTSVLKSTLPGFGDCTGVSSILIGSLTLHTKSPPLMGCIGPGTVNSSARAANNSLIVTADVTSAGGSANHSLPVHRRKRRYVLRDCSCH